jgi:hypothetical protein
MLLHDTLDAMRKKYESNLPPGIVSTMHRATDSLLQSGIMESVLKEGEPAPEFSLPDANGEKVDSSVLLHNGPLVVSFYRGSW